MKYISISALQEVVQTVRTPEAVADHFDCSIEAAKRMLNLVAAPDLFENMDYRAAPEPPPQKRRLPVLCSEGLPEDDPEDDPQEWSYERMKHEMRIGSENLLIRQLETGQHRLPAELAEALLRQFGVQPNFGF